MRYSFILGLALAALSVTSNGFAEDQGAAARSGAEVFDESCAGCHTGGFAGFFSGAPELGDKGDFESLVSKGLDGLTANTLTGFGSMSARGGCAECSDAEIQAAVAYMLESVK